MQLSQISWARLTSLTQRCTAWLTHAPCCLDQEKAAKMHRNNKYSVIVSEMCHELKIIDCAKLTEFSAMAAALTQVNCYYSLFFCWNETKLAIVHTIITTSAPYIIENTQIIWGPLLPILLDTGWRMIASDKYMPATANQDVISCDTK